MTTTLETRIDETPSATAPLRILIVDDSESDVDVLRRLLRKVFGPRTEVLATDLGRDAVEMAAANRSTRRWSTTDCRTSVGWTCSARFRSGSRARRWCCSLARGARRSPPRPSSAGAQDYLVKRDITADALRDILTQALHGARQRTDSSHAVEKLKQTNSELDHAVRSLSHDMHANFHGHGEFVSADQSLVRRRRPAEPAQRRVARLKPA